MGRFRDLIEGKKAAAKEEVFAPAPELVVEEVYAPEPEPVAEEVSAPKGNVLITPDEEVFAPDAEWRSKHCPLNLPHNPSRAMITR